MASRLFRLFSSSISLSSLSMCSFVLARMARCASRSLARLRASCEGVRLDTLLVPVRLSAACLSLYGRNQMVQSTADLSASVSWGPRLMVT